MKVIKTISEVKQLDLPLSVMEQLIGHILEPWSGDLTQAEKFWEEVATCLILIEPSDTDQELPHVSGETELLLSYAVNNPEYVLVLNDESSPFLLALTVHSDEGSGAYLLAPMSSDTHPVRVLKELAE
ncbi:hypothetical protein [Vibrio parahaemolyticus]|uniref:hypothetical protein n=1 Tax=Vibrio parahaemolyticus TaxID=670 RepID=UPI00111E6993|nr:hypothetical protein [Vibrio parahaemolyticus]ELA8131903.1 hypothetical protein [Vibrio parahaemolyticus]MBE3953527.1 hypothetical protein [Vibrio parahaemolyticus]TOK50800.1 hypothetical protein CGI17_24415 [Vibrio parahaemolyticus]TOK78210.1 hypothetical protein CGI11_20750 [Vibrio parahaemolyticus]TOK83712.1 hypothetical protein CGI10_19740 [Vibrio parahaemolyticus]